VWNNIRPCSVVIVSLEVKLAASCLKGMISSQYWHATFFYSNVIPSFCDNGRVPIVDLTVASAVLLEMRPSNPQLNTDNSSSTVLLFLFLWNSPNVYTLVWKHTNKWWNICTFQIPSANKIVRQIHNWHRQLFKCSQCII
jgi:hypothetical protein